MVAPKVLLVVALLAAGALAALRDELDDEIALLEEREMAMTPPPECVLLQSVHSPNAMMEFYKQYAATNPQANMSDACAEAARCEKVVAPFMTPGGSLKSQCYLSCSGAGICVNGECLCSPGFEGRGCENATTTCPGNGCNGHGRCWKGTCDCEPGYEGVACEKSLDCFRGGDGEPCYGHGKCHRGKCFCDPGFTGEKCNRVSRCPNDCSNLGFCLHGQCFCPPGRGGPDCNARLVTTSCPNSCSGHGKCKDGLCHCDAGHYGRDCSQIVECPRGTNGLQCSGFGSCHNGQCECNEGRMGFHCDIQSACPGNGTCSDNGVCLRGSCYCYPGYTGADCATQSACRYGCNGKGVCVQGHCKCLPGYHGELCEEGTGPKIVVDGAIVPQYCPSNGSAASGFDQGTVRALMNLGKCPNGCSGSGVCLNGTCACLPGFDGADCSNVVQHLPCPNECSFRGVCVFGKCRCQPPYKGVDCADSEDPDLAVADQKACPKQCNGRGKCRVERGMGHCACDPGYAGPSCEIEVPCPHNCHGRGQCDRGKCFCMPGFAGASCEKAAACPAGCSKHGQCFYGKCFCDSFYAGEDCSKTPHCSKGCDLEHGNCRGNDLCACEPGWTGVACTERLQCPNDCSGLEHGACYATEQGAKCICRTGWMGDDCSKDVNKCPGTPTACSGNGICSMGKCTCDSGFSGEACDIKIGSGGLLGVMLSSVAQPMTQPPSVNASAPRFAQVRSQMGAQALLRMAEGGATELACPNNCNTHGVCANGMCFCNPGHTGEDCGIAVTCPNDCSAHGICKYGQCWCGPSYVGDDCSVYTTAGRQLPTTVIAGIIAALMFFVGIIVGRKTIARSGLKFTESLGEPVSQAKLRDPIA